MCVSGRKRPSVCGADSPALLSVEAAREKRGRRGRASPSAAAHNTDSYTRPRTTSDRIDYRYRFVDGFLRRLNEIFFFLTKFVNLDSTRFCIIRSTLVVNFNQLYIRFVHEEESFIRCFSQHIIQMWSDKYVKCSTNIAFCFSYVN